MFGHSHSGPDVRPLLPALTLILTSCMEYQAVTSPLPSDSAFSIRGSVRITEVSGRVHWGASAVGRGDQLVLTRNDGTLDSVPRRAVATVERGIPGDGRSFGWVALGVGLALLLLIGLSGAAFAPPPG